MSADTLQLLCTGDIHLGLHPTRIPSEYDGPVYSPKRIWGDIVQLAIDKSVDGVLISGDVVDRENRYFEAYGPFEEGARRLDKAGIPTVLVGGNHDFDVLPNLIENLDLEHVSLIGHNGSWERYSVNQAGEPLFHVDGWSFPSEHVLYSPIGDYDPLPAAEPVLGLVHGDLDSTDGDYAPIIPSTLESTSADAWILGHIHSPGVRQDSDPLILYPGSPQPLDPGEPGTHGPRLVEISPGGSVASELHPLASIRYDSLDVSLVGVDDTKDIPPRIREQVESTVKAEYDTRALEFLSLRVRVHGRTPIHGDLVRKQGQIEETLRFQVGSLPVHVESLDVDTAPSIDLEELATDESPVGYLAQLLLELDEGDITEDWHPLVETATDRVQTVNTSGTYAPLQREGREIKDERAYALARLEDQARLLLQDLLEQSDISS